MLAIEKENASLKGVLPKEYARPALNAVMPGELIDLISNIALGQTQDTLGMCWGGRMSFFGSVCRVEG
jgi:type I restriction enzyme M protein